MTIGDVIEIVRPQRCSISNEKDVVDTLLTDSRSLSNPSRTLFFAITTRRNSGVYYIEELYEKGVRSFVVPSDYAGISDYGFSRLQDVNVMYVADVVDALQRLAAHHRKQYALPVVGITGSNGKTIVKEWAVQMLSADKKVVASPRSYNSQIGVPLSVWQMTEGDELAIFEAGISEQGEMDRLRNVIQPTIGIFTNIGQAHDEGFVDRGQKIAEKLKLFEHCRVLIYCSDHDAIHAAVLGNAAFRQVDRFTWGNSDDCNLRIQSVQSERRVTKIQLKFAGQSFEVKIPFVDKASIENALHCISLMCCLGYAPEQIAQRCGALTPIAMRMERMDAVGGCVLINDSYSLDLSSLNIALDYLQTEHRLNYRTLILSDVPQTGLDAELLYTRVADIVVQHGVRKFIAIGESIGRWQHLFSEVDAFFYNTTEEFLHKHPLFSFQQEMILLKGARVFHFEEIAKALQQHTHETVLEVSLSALTQNLTYYRSRLWPATKLMAMVKAASYGAGTVEIANALQYNQVDYLTVAYADEGVELRRGGITIPIMVMNPEEASYGDLIRYRLEPDVYSFRVLRSFMLYAANNGCRESKVPIHIEFDTGMHRLGFSGMDIKDLAAMLTGSDCPLQVKSIFSHLACSEDELMDSFTQAQIERFRMWSDELSNHFPASNICRHILNSSGITRFPNAQMNMVRLGIGLYGISPEPNVQQNLALVSRLRSRISQIKTIERGDSVGYNCGWVAPRRSNIAIVPIGYADGLFRALGGGVGCFYLHGHKVPIVGKVCMDMCFVDVTSVECSEYDEITLFETAEQLQELAAAASTIPYELLTAISPRVKRVYVQE